MLDNRKFRLGIILLTTFLLVFGDEHIGRRGALFIDTVKSIMAREAAQVDAILNRSYVIPGKGHLQTEFEEPKGVEKLPPRLIPLDFKIHHKHHPPVPGSLCDYKSYKKFFGRYFSLPYLDYTDRLYEYKIIKAALHLGNGKASTEGAWSLCQFAGMMMECGENGKCICLNRNPPYRYTQVVLQENDTCAGLTGSRCSLHPIAPIPCVEGLNCTEGYCGGLELAARTLMRALNDFPQALAPTSLIWILPLLIIFY